MNAFLLNRQLGSISHQALAKAQNNRLLKALHGTEVRFALENQSGAGLSSTRDGVSRVRDVAHAAGVNSIAIDRFEGR
jgi:DNA excision repair protein ERCC-8